MGSGPEVILHYEQVLCLWGAEGPKVPNDRTTVTFGGNPSQFSSSQVKET